MRAGWPVEDPLPPTQLICNYVPCIQTVSQRNRNNSTYYHIISSVYEIILPYHCHIYLPFCDYRLLDGVLLLVLSLSPTTLQLSLSLSPSLPTRRPTLVNTPNSNCKLRIETHQALVCTSSTGQGGWNAIFESIYNWTQKEEKEKKYLYIVYVCIFYKTKQG